MSWEEAIESKQIRVFQSNSSGHAIASFYDAVYYWPLGSDNTSNMVLGKMSISYSFQWNEPVLFHIRFIFNLSSIK